MGWGWGWDGRGWGWGWDDDGDGDGMEWDGMGPGLLGLGRPHRPPPTRPGPPPSARRQHRWPRTCPGNAAAGRAGPFREAEAGGGRAGPGAERGEQRGSARPPRRGIPGAHPATAAAFPSSGGGPVPHTPPTTPHTSGPPPHGRPRPPRSPRSRPPHRAPRCGRAGGAGGEPGQLPAGGARPLQHMCCHSAVPAVIVAPGRGCAMGPPLLLACLLAPLCARVRDGAGGWGALRWCWGERWGGGCGARAPMDALSRGRRGWGFGGTVAFLTL